MSIRGCVGGRKPGVVFIQKYERSHCQGVTCQCTRRKERARSRGRKRGTPKGSTRYSKRGWQRLVATSDVEKVDVAGEQGTGDRRMAGYEKRRGRLRGPTPLEDRAPLSIVQRARHLRWTKPSHLGLPVGEHVCPPSPKLCLDPSSVTVSASKPSTSPVARVSGVRRGCGIDGGGVGDSDARTLLDFASAKRDRLSGGRKGDRRTGFERWPGRGEARALVTSLRVLVVGRRLRAAAVFCNVRSEPRLPLATPCGQPRGVGALLPPRAWHRTTRPGPLLVLARAATWLTRQDR